MRKLSIIAPVALLAAVALVWSLFPTGSTNASVATSGADEPTEADKSPSRGGKRVGSNPLPAPLPTAEGSQRAPEQVRALEARDRRRKEALGQFQMKLLAGLDECMAQRPAPRAPQRLVLRFERTAPGIGSADDAHERFKLTGVTLAGMPPGTDPSSTPAGKCIEGLRGRTMDIPKGSANQESELTEVVTLPLPISLGAPAQQPQFPQ